MKLARFFSLLLFFICASQKLAGADNIKMIFLYPGEAGNTALAQPVLDSFFDYINKRIAPNTLSGKYFNDLASGLKYLKSERPKLAIVSFSAYQLNPQAFTGAKAFLKTLPLPDGKDTETYYIVGGKQPASGKLKLYSREPMRPEFVNKFIAPDLKDFEILSADNILPLLRDSAEGKISAGIILKATEYNTVKGLSSDWAKKVTLWKESAPVPSAPFLMFDPQLPSSAKLKEVLLKMPGDKEGKDILTELRLKGFAE